MNPWLFILLISVFNSAFASLPTLKSHINNKQYIKAIKIGEALKKQNPDSASVLFYTALAYQNNKQLKLAKNNYLKAIQLNPQLPEVYNNLANIYVTEKNYTQAAKTLTAAINSQPSIATAYANLSLIYRHLASQAYQQVLSDSSRSKQTKVTIKIQLLASLDLNETIVKPTTQKSHLPSPKQAIINWAKAWKTKQYLTYINSYSNNYAPKNLNHNQWLVQRKKRIQRPGNIMINVTNFDIMLSKKNAYVNFDQTYRSSTYHDKVRKRMHLMFMNKQWRIVSELTLSIL